MKIGNLATLSQVGLRAFCADVHGNDLMPDDLGSNPESWAWLWFQLRVAEDNPDWFPSGKWATIQEIERRLNEEAAAATARRVK